jgi:hypothetical protein
MKLLEVWYDYGKNKMENVGNGGGRLLYSAIIES